MSETKEKAPQLNELQVQRGNEYLHALEPYGQVQVVREMARRIQALDKSKIPLNGGEAAHLAQLAVSHDLNPFSGEIWGWIQEKGGKRLFNWMPGRRGIIRHANEQAAARGSEWWSDERELTEHEKDTLMIPRDALAYESRVFDKATMDEWRETFKTLENGLGAEEALRIVGQPPCSKGIGVLTQQEISKMPRDNRMPHANRAKKRALMEALKGKYSLHFGGSSGGSGGETFEDYVVDAKGAIDVDFKDVTDQEPYGVERGSYGGLDRLNPKFWKGACEKIVEAGLARDPFVAAEMLAYSRFEARKKMSESYWARMIEYFEIAKEIYAEQLEEGEATPESIQYKDVAIEASKRLGEKPEHTKERHEREAAGIEPEPYVGTKLKLDDDGLEGADLTAYTNMAKDYPSICPKHDKDWGTAYKFAGQPESGVTRSQFQGMVKSRGDDVRKGMAELLGYY